MDALYSSISARCGEILVANNELNDSLRLIGNKHIPNDVIVQINKLFASL